MKKQILIIHGGDTFETEEAYFKFLRDYQIDINRYTSDKDDWKKWLREELPDHEVILPTMPNKTNARFEEWKLWMDKLTPYMNNDIILIGHSLGGSFLAKYLSENKLPKKIKAVFLVSAVYDKDSEGYSLLSFSLPEKLDLQSDAVYLYHSKDDPVVPFSALEKYKQALPKANIRVFEDRQHINQEKFPELLEDIKNLNWRAGDKIMNSKTIIFVGMFVGSTAGSLLASVFGADYLSLTSALLSFIGGAVGVYFGYKIANN